MTAHDAQRAERVFEVIEEFTDEFGHSPSVRQLMERVGLASTAAVHYHLQRLVKLGRITPCECQCGRYRLAYDGAA